MKEKKPTANTTTKQPRPLAWQVAVRHLPASPQAMPDGCNDCGSCGCAAPLRQPHAATGKQS